MEINLITFEQAQKIDQKTIEKGIEEKLLMGLASQSALITMMHQNLISNKFIYIFLCGNGNNGGDGLALAYLLSGTLSIPKDQILIFLKYQPKTESSQFYYQMLLKNNFQIKPLEIFLEESLDFFLYEKVILIEALLGTGQKNLPRTPYKEVLKKISIYKNKYQFKILHIALDIPAGLSEEYEFFNEKDYFDFFDLPIPDYILNFGLKKLVLIHPLIHSFSKIFVLPCGFDPEMQNYVVKKDIEFIEWELLNHFNIFKKKSYEHKYQSGYGWLLAGSNNMEGAAILSAKSFFYSGGGILHLIHFSQHSNFFLSIEPSIIYHNFEEWKNNYSKFKLPKSIVIGPGISREDLEFYKLDILKFFEYLVFKKYFPIIILDAYASILIKENNYPEKLKPYTIITPHLGEWKLLNGDFPYLVSNWKNIFNVHKELGVSILIKGSISFFIPSSHFKEKKIYIWKYQNPHLSVAGSGDVLTGILLSYFSKIEHFSYEEICKGINTILSLQYHIANNHSTANDQINNLKNLINK